jgi:hypothetical protein
MLGYAEYINIKMGQIHKFFFGFTPELSIINFELFRGYTLGQQFWFSTTKYISLKKEGTGFLSSSLYSCCQK